LTLDTDYIKERVSALKMFFLCLVFLSVTLSVTVEVPRVIGKDTEKSGSGVRTLYLIRHGQYDHEDERDPDVGRALVPLGIAQARLVAARLRALPVEMTSLHSSTMTRARQTCRVIGGEFPKLELQQSRLLRECTPPTWREDIMDDVDPVETMDCLEQLEKAFAEYFTPSPDSNRHDIIVCHGNVIRWFVTRVLKVDSLAWLGMSIGNCSLTVVKIKPDGAMKLLSYGDVGHIPPNLQTGLQRGKRRLVLPESVP
jgi:serine/threonine-protein phosphatase PGAM5